MQVVETGCWRRVLVEIAGAGAAGAAAVIWQRAWWRLGGGAGRRRRRRRWSGAGASAGVVSWQSAPLLVSAGWARCGGAVSWLRRLRTVLFQPVACQQVVGFCLAIWVYAGVIIASTVDMEPGCTRRCRVPLPDAWPCALWSLVAGAAADRCVAARALELGRWCRCRVLLHGVAARCPWPCALERRVWPCASEVDVCGHVGFGVWVLAPVAGCRVLLQPNSYGSVGLRACIFAPLLWCCRQVVFRYRALWSLDAGAAAGCCELSLWWALVPLQGAARGVWPFALWSLDASVYGAVPFGTCTLVPLHICQMSTAACAFGAF